MSSVTAEPDRAGPAGGRPRRRLTTAGVAAVVIAAVAITASRLTSGPGPHRAVNSKATTTATVQRTNLAETTPVNGTVGFASPYTIVQPAGTSSQAVTQAQQSAAQAQGNLTADQKAVADTSASDAQSVTQAQQALATAQAALVADTTQLRSDQAALAAAQQKQANDCQGSGSAGSGASGAGQTGGSTPCATDTTQVNTDQQKVIPDQQKVAADQAAVQNEQGQVTSAQQKQAQGSDQGQAKVAADQLALTNARSALATDQATATAYDPTSKYTALPAVGEVINPGQSLWSVDGQLVPLLPGTLISWRAFNAGMSDGADVAALNQALIDLGDGNGLTVTDAFTDATAAAIERLQGSFGLPETGSLALGSVVFEPTAVRVTTVHPLVGNSVGGGQPVLDVTSTTPVVNVALPVGQTYRVKVGDPVSVNLPDGTIGEGTITAVGTVATSTTPSNSGSSTTSATVNVIVSLSKPSPAGSLDEAPVTVNITNNSAHQVLAVPTTALLALADGGYAVEVVEPDGAHQLVGVTTGIFDDQSGMVQVSGSGLAAGQQVVAAA
jgi:multidrug efflux pump subunit AcrA (membrane-fusion protein)